MNSFSSLTFLVVVLCISLNIQNGMAQYYNTYVNPADVAALNQAQAYQDNVAQQARIRDAVNLGQAINTQNAINEQGFYRNVAQQNAINGLG